MNEASLIERVARILCMHADRDPDEIVQGEGAAQGETWRGWQAFATEARRAIIGVRTPTEAMIAAGAECNSMLVSDIYTAMIDAALAHGDGL